MAKYVEVCLVELDLVPMQEVGPDGATRFWCGGHEFLYEGTTLFVRVSVSLLPLVTLPCLSAAIYFANGLCIGLHSLFPVFGEMRRGK